MATAIPLALDGGVIVVIICEPVDTADTSAEEAYLRRFLARFMLCDKQKTIIFLKCRNR